MLKWINNLFGDLKIMIFIIINYVFNNLFKYLLNYLILSNLVLHIPWTYGLIRQTDEICYLTS